MEASKGTRVFRHPEIVEDQADISCELSHFLCDAAYALGFDESNGKAPKSGNIFWAIAGTYPAAVFVVDPVEDIVTAIFDAPLAAVDGQKALSIGLGGGTARDPISEVVGVLSVFFLNRFSLNDKGLLHVREIQVGVEVGGGPDFSSFDAAMIWRVIGDEIGFFSILEIQLDILQECGLVAFDGEVVMGLPILDQVMGEVALGQEGIGSDIFALDIDGIEQRDGHLDLVGLL